MSDDRTSEFLTLAKGLGPANDRLAFGINRSTTTGLSSSSYPQTLNRFDNSDTYSSNGSNQATAATTTTTAATTAVVPANSAAYAELRQFHTTAAGISHDIASTSALLTELTQLVRSNQQSLFQEDDAIRINQLVIRIKGSIENLNSRLDQAGKVIAQQKRRLGQNSQASQEAANLVDGLKTEFAQAASGFKRVLQQRTDNMKDAETFSKQVYGRYDNDVDDDDDDDPMPNMSAALAAPPPVFGGHNTSTSSSSAAFFPTLDLTSSLMGHYGGMATGEPTSSSSSPGIVLSTAAGTITNNTNTLPRPHGINSTSNSATNSGNYSELRLRRSAASSHQPYPLDPSGTTTNSGYYGSGTDGTATMMMTPFDIQRMEEETGISQQMQLIPDQNYLRERADAMSAVESNIVELGTIFNKLAVMVSEHREMVQRVEDNVEDTQSNINLSMNVLTDTLANLQNNKALMMRLIPILLVFIISFIIFFA